MPVTVRLRPDARRAALRVGQVVKIRQQDECAANQHNGDGAEQQSIAELRLRSGIETTVLIFFSAATVAGVIPANSCHIR